MKRLLFIFIFIAFPLILFSFPFVDTNTNKKLKLSESDISISRGSVCIEGYKFAWIKTGGRNGVALVQIFKQSKYTNAPQPIKCK